ncbi:MAG: D-alanine--D-alanine ligase family protein [Actinomycetota bacterium]
MAALKVAIVAGGLAHERDVSIRSGRRVAQTLRDEGMEVKVWDLDSRLIPRLAEWRPDVVWPLVHGADGEDGSLQDLFALLGLRFVGADGHQARIAFHKPTAKALMQVVEVATPRWVTLRQSLFRQVGAKGVLDAIVATLGLPLVVKPADGGSALGVTVVRDAAQLPEAMVGCFAYSDEALIEEFVEGTEIAASMVADDDGVRVLPLVEIVTEGPYDYDARYNAGRSEYFVPARLSDAAAAAVRDAVTTVHETFALGDLSRVDVIQASDGTVWVLDINVAPGMTETSLFPQAAASEGGRLYAGIVERVAARDVTGPGVSPRLTGSTGGDGVGPAAHD